jgi:hypothetical protein
MQQTPQTIKLQGISQNAVEKAQTEIIRDFYEAKITVLIAIYEQIFGRKPALDEKDVFTIVHRAYDPDTEHVYLNDPQKQIFLGIMETTPTGVTFQPSNEFAQ